MPARTRARHAKPSRLRHVAYTAGLSTAITIPLTGVTATSAAAHPLLTRPAAVAAAAPVAVAQPTLRQGARGLAVAELQRRLGGGLAADGVFGSLTLRAVLSLQSGRGLVADGIVGPLTWRALGGQTVAAPVSIPAPARVCSSALAGTQPHVARAGHHLAARFGVPLTSILGRAGRTSNTSDHPDGYALDFVVGRDKGDAIAAYALENRTRLGVTYVIWRQRYNDGSGWRLMADRGGVTANHYDHVHVSFSRTAPSAAISCG